MIIKRKYGNFYLSYNDKTKTYRYVKDTPDEITFLINKERIFHEFEFVSVLKRESSLLVDNVFVLAINNNTLYIFKQKTDKSLEAYLQYEFPGNNSKEFWLRILNIEEGECREIYYMGLNNFTFITHDKFLAVMVKYYEILDRGEKPYKEARITSKNGKVRDIIVPHEEIKAVLRDLNTSFQRIFDPKNRDFQVAYKKGKNVLSNAIIHKDNPFIFKLDLKNFFPSCTKDIVSEKISFLFTNSFNKNILMEEFFKTILYNDALFIGSPISGTLANYCISNAALMIKNIAAKNNVKFSIYADDMTFSSDRFISEAYVNGIISFVFEELGLENTFGLNTKKSVGQSKNRRHITGVSFNMSNEPTSSRAISRFIRNGLYRSKNGGAVDKAVLKGKIQYALSIEGFNGKVSRMLKKEETLVKNEKFLSKEQEGKIFAK